MQMVISSFGNKAEIKVLLKIKRIAFLHAFLRKKKVKKLFKTEKLALT